MSPSERFFPNASMHKREGIIAGFYGIYVTVPEKTRDMRFFVEVEFYVWLIISTIELSFRLTVHFVVKIQRFVCDRTTPLIKKKLRSKGIAMHAYGISAYYASPRNQLTDYTWNVDDVLPVTAKLIYLKIVY